MTRSNLTRLVCWFHFLLAAALHVRESSAFSTPPFPKRPCHHQRQSSRSILLRGTSSSTSSLSSSSLDQNKGKLLILGGTGFLGQAICKRAAKEGYVVTSLSRRGLPSPSSSSINIDDDPTDYRKGDARKIEAIENILQEGGYVGGIHCIGLLFDQASGLAEYNRFASGSASIPDENSTYDSIVRLTAFNAIDVVSKYVKTNNPVTGDPFPFCFVSAAEVGWPDVAGGTLIESLAPDFLKRYLEAKRAVESKLLQSSLPSSLRPIIVRPSLIYSMDRPASYLPVGAFFVGNKLGLPFVDRPVTVQNLATAIVRAISQPAIKGILRYPDIDRLNEEL